MKPFSLIFVLFAAVCLPLSADEAAIEWTGSQTDYGGDGPFVLGFRFYVEEDTVVSALGAYDSGGNGLQAAHTVAIWRASGGSPIVTAVVPSGTQASLEGHFRYTQIPDFVLSGGTEYVVGASQFGTGAGSDRYAYNANGIVLAPEITWLAKRSEYTPDGGVQFPTSEYAERPGVSGTPFGATFKIKRREPLLFGLCIGQNEEQAFRNLVRGDKGAQKIFSRLSKLRLWASEAEGNPSAPVVFNESLDDGTRESVYTLIDRMQVREGDTFVFYFNGHAGPHTKTDGSAIDPGNETEVISEIVNNPLQISLQRTREDEFLACGLSDDDLATIFASPKWAKVRKIFFIDSCHSGGFVGTSDSDLGDLERVPNTALFASSKEEKLSYTVNNSLSLDFGMGIWTRDLLLPAFDNAGISCSGLVQYFSAHQDDVEAAWFGLECGVLDLNAPGTSAIFDEIAPVHQFSPDFDASSPVFLGVQTAATNNAQKAILVKKIKKLQKELKKAKKGGNSSKVKVLKKMIKELQKKLRLV